jgi:hypothetical protein
MMFKLYLNVFLLISFVAGFPLIHNKNHACEPSDSTWTKFTGIRVQHEILARIDAKQTLSRQAMWLNELAVEMIDQANRTYNLTEKFKSEIPLVEIDHEVVLTKCEFGKVQYEMAFPVIPTLDIAWNQSICRTDKQEKPVNHWGIINAGWWAKPRIENPDPVCYRLARRKKFAQRKLNLYKSGSIVGGLFISLCPNSTDCNEWEPVLPLLAENPLHSWTQIRMARRGLGMKTRAEIGLAHRIPLLHTPDVLDRKYPKSQQWAVYVDKFENYDSLDTRGIRNRIMDAVSGMMSRTQGIRNRPVGNT